jgi:hypothetical protein
VQVDRPPDHELPLPRRHVGGPLVGKREQIGPYPAVPLKVFVDRSERQEPKGGRSSAQREDRGDDDPAAKADRYASLA